MSDKPKITNEEIEQFKQLAQAATSDVPWWWGTHKSASIEDAEKWCGEMLRHAPDSHELHMVYALPEWQQEVMDDAVVTAFTGNGPRSEQNAKFIQLANPQNVINLLDDLKEMRDLICDAVEHGVYEQDNLYWNKMSAVWRIHRGALTPTAKNDL